MVKTILLSVQQQLYAKRCLKQQLNFQEMSVAVTQCKLLEEHITKSNQSIVKHITKWMTYDKIHKVGNVSIFVQLLLEVW